MIKTKFINWTNYFNKKSYIVSVFIVGIFLPFIFVFAQGESCDPGLGKICNPISATSITELIRTILEGVVKIGIPVIALAIIYCGFLFVQARGKPGEIERARNSLEYTLLGAAIILGAWAIAQLITETVLAL